MKEKYIKYFMDVAELTANLSNAIKLKVGTVIVKDDRIISCGYNSTPAGWDNTCEEEIIIPNLEYNNLSTLEKSEYKVVLGGYLKLKTHDHVIHSEANALSRLAKSTESGVDSILFCTHTPCIQCSKSIYSSGIKKVYYKNIYKTTDGIDFLTKCGIRGNKNMKKYINNRIQELKFLWQYLSFEYTKVCYENNASQLDKLLYLNFSKFEYMYDEEYPFLSVQETETLYNWWKSRDSREDPFERYNDFIDTLSDSSSSNSKFYFSEIWKLENTNVYADVQLQLKNARYLESKYFFEDKEMLHRVIDIMISCD